MLIKKAAAFVTAVVMMTMQGASVSVCAADSDNSQQAAVPETVRLGAGRGSFVLTPSVSSLEEGGTVTVTLSIGSNPGINGMLLDIVYDPDVFQVSSYSYIPNFFYGSNYSVHQFNFEDMLPGRVPVMWSDATKTDSNGNAASFNNTGDIVELTFTVKSGAPTGNYEFSVEYNDKYVFRTLGTSEESEGFEPVPFDVESCQVAVGKALTASNTSVTLGSYDSVYDGSEKTPLPTVKFGGQLLTEGTDYTVSYADNVNAGTAKAIIRGMGMYAGIVSKTFAITEASIKEASATLSPTSCEYDGTPQMPSVTVIHNGKTLRNGTDYTLTYSNNTEPGTGSVKIVGKGNYTGNLYRYFPITQLSLEDAIMTVSTPTVTYDGTARTLKPTIKYGSEVLAEGIDYTLSYSSNTKVGIAIITATGIGRYTGTLSGQFAIVPRDLSGAVVTLGSYSFEYSGEPKFPEVTVEDNGKKLVENKDYTVTFLDNTEIGTGTVKIVGKGNYTGTLNEHFTIGMRTVSACEITLPSAAIVYDGSAKKPVPTVVYSGTETLKNGVDFELTYSENVNAGTAVMTITGIGRYSGAVTRSFEIQPKSISGGTVTLSPSSYVYDGNAKSPEVTVKLGSKKLVLDTDYTTIYSANTEIGTGTVKIEGKGNYTGTLYGYFTIEGKELSLDDVTLDQTSFVYDGTAKKPVPTVKSGSVTLEEGVDYEVAYLNNVNAGTAYLTVTGIGGYSGSISSSFNISPRPISRGKVTVTPTSFIYDGKEQTPEVAVTENGVTLVEGTDYTKTYSDNTEVGTAKVTVSGKGNYTGKLDGFFNIDEDGSCVFSLTASDSSPAVGRKFSIYVSIDSNPGIGGFSFDVEYAPEVFRLDGCTVTPGFFEGSSKEVECTKDGDGTQHISWEGDSAANNEGTVVKLDFTVKTDAEPGSYDITVPKDSIQIVGGTGGDVPVSAHDFTVNVTSLRQITNAELEIDQSAIIYDGTAQTPAVTVIDDGKTLEEGVDYTVTYGDNTDSGKGFLTVTGKGAYTGSFSRQFTIRPKGISGTEIALDLSSATYTGSEITPEVIVKDGERTLVPGTDYTVSYSANVNAGEATVTVSGTGNYTGTVNKQFDINPKSITGATADITETTVSYTGSEIRPAVTVKLGGETLVSGTDYKVTYTDNTEAGTATVTISGKGNYTGTITRWFTILANELTSGCVGLASKSFYYTGSAITPPPQVIYGTDWLISGTDYEVSYSDNVNVGTATMTVTGIGKYMGSVSKTFTIAPRSITAATVTLSVDSFFYDGTEKRPSVIVKDGTRTLVQGTDYTIAYSNNTEAGTAIVTVSGKDNYSGDITAEFVIKQGQGFTYGDLDDDGDIDVDDLVLMQKLVAGWKVNVNMRAADVYPDGTVGADDLVLMQKYIAGWNVTLGKNV